MRIAKLELHQLPFNLHRLFFEVCRHKRVMRAGLGGSQYPNGKD
jgi:hypothetical protein